MPATWMLAWCTVLVEESHPLSGQLRLPQRRINDFLFDPTSAFNIRQNVDRTPLPPRSPPFQTKKMRPYLKLRFENISGSLKPPSRTHTSGLKRNSYCLPQPISIQHHLTAVNLARHLCHGTSKWNRPAGRVTTELLVVGTLKFLCDPSIKN